MPKDKKQLGKILYLASNKNRIEILEFCKEPKTITEIEKGLGMGHGTAGHHLKILEKVKLIKRDKKKQKKGQPVMIKTVKNFWRVFEGIEKKLDKQNKPIYLKLLSLMNPKINKEDLIKRISIDSSLKKIDNIWLIINFLNIKGLTKERILVTDKGQKFLQENQK